MDNAVDFQNKTQQLMNLVMEDSLVGLKIVQEDWNVLNTRIDQFKKN